MNTFNVTSFGAAADGQTNDTLAIQAAIDEAGRSGGVVLVPAGIYRIGTIVLRSGIRLHLDAGAVLVGSIDIADYRDDIGCFIDGVGQKRGISLIYAEEAERISITGEGTIDGQGEYFRKDRGYTGVRPFLVRFVRCHGIEMQGVTLKDSAAWVSHYHECSEVDITGVTIRSRVNSNNDGIDIDSCSHVRIHDCDIDTGDDAIVLKSTTVASCEYIAIRHCKLRSNWAGIKFGTESLGGFRHVTVADCYIYDTNGCGIKLLTVDGAPLEHVELSDITMEQVSGPIFLRLGSRLRTYMEGQQSKSAGVLRNIVFRNIKANVKELPDRKSAVCISGIPGHPVENIVFDNVDITFPGGTTEEIDYHAIPELETAYPEYYMFGTAPAYGMFLRHVKGITLKQVTLKTMQPDLRPEMVLVDVTGMQQ
ncbi:glycoside hydrolase family 28 protein [Paenibacillus sp. NPDC056579]|uniref:glycoside hydrolase family 28 protein n=1 Tax=Paenibacillus sp. NPDC056579 TaxID=3345871 RepID=UPI00367624C5